MKNLSQIQNGKVHAHRSCSLLTTLGPSKKAAILFLGPKEIC